MPRSFSEKLDARDDALKRLRQHSDNRFALPWELVSNAAYDHEADDTRRLDALTLVDELRQHIDSWERQLLESLRENREDPVPWKDIAAALGVTRQGAERRFLRATAQGQRNADWNRRALKSRRQEAEEKKQLTVARWGRYGQAEKDWSLTFRARTTDGQEVIGHLKGREAASPDLRFCWVEGSDRLARVSDLEVLEVTEEVTPWEGVDPPADPLAGLTRA